MKVDSINPFIESVYELFETMIGTSLKRGDIAVSEVPSKHCEVTAMIGMSGAIRGTVALAFPVNTAISLVNKLLETDLHIMDDTITDGIAELVNIVGGSAKAKFPVQDGAEPVALTLPTVIRGQDYKVAHPSGAVWLEVPFESDLGGFKLRVTLQEES